MVNLNPPASLTETKETTYVVYLETLHVQYPIYLIYGPRREKTCLRGFANNTGSDQPAHPRRLISAFVIRFIESIISKLATSEISML